MLAALGALAPTIPITGLRTWDARTAGPQREAANVGRKFRELCLSPIHFASPPPGLSSAMDHEDASRHPGKVTPSTWAGKKAERAGRVHYS
jgi:hypothetical protein